MTILLALSCVSNLHAQRSDIDEKSRASVLSIMQAEDELRFDETIESYLKGSETSLRIRAALAAGRIGDPKAIPLLSALLVDSNAELAQMAAFALGEIESDDAAIALSEFLEDTDKPDAVRARVVEAAGKIAGANSESRVQQVLGRAIVENLEFEIERGIKQSREVVLFGITAVIRAKPEDGDHIVAKFLTNLDDRVRLDSANAIARLGSKKYNQQLKIMLVSDTEPLARANAARALGAAKDETAVGVLTKAATQDADQRARVNAIGALGRIADKAGADKLFVHAEKLILDYGKSKYKRPPETNELLTLASAFGNILKNTNDQRALKFLNKLSKLEKQRSPEVEVALIRVSPTAYTLNKLRTGGSDWQKTSAIAQAFGVFSSAPDSVENENVKSVLKKSLQDYLKSALSENAKMDKSVADILSAYAEFKTEDLNGFLRSALKKEDLIVRGTAANLLGDASLDKEKLLENYNALKDAYENSKSDSLNDATLSTLGALKKQILLLKEQKEITADIFESVKDAAESPDYLVRKSARTIANDVGIEIEQKPERVSFDEKGVSRVKRADYSRALTREKAKAVLMTAKGKFTIEFYPQEAPLTVENFINLAKSGYFNGLSIHRVVPNFVMQDGDPRGDGNGGPGWQIRCEINQVTFERGSVGMALSGKDTGGSQWFVAHSPQPHLDGGYTVFGRVNEEGMKVVDRLVRGDVIEKVEIIE